MLRFQHGFPGELTKKQPLSNADRTSPLVSRPNQCIQREAERNRSRRVTDEVISLPVFFRPWKRRLALWRPGSFITSYLPAVLKSRMTGLGRGHIAAGLLPAVEAADTKRGPEAANAST